MKYFHALGLVTLIVAMLVLTFASAQVKSGNDGLSRTAKTASNQQFSYSAARNDIRSGPAALGVAAALAGEAKEPPRYQNAYTRLIETRETLPEVAPLMTSMTRPLPSKSRIINRAYLDALVILSDDNTCSRFFGGPFAALPALTDLTRQLHIVPLGSRAGIRMSGEFTTIAGNANRVTYRLFKKVEVNSSGPFNFNQSLRPEVHAGRVGSYLPYTRESRVLMLLHELGHLVAGRDGNWLLPNDGNNESQSLKNTALVETRCGEQIRALDERETPSSNAQATPQSRREIMMCSLCNPKDRFPGVATSQGDFFKGEVYAQDQIPGYHSASFTAQSEFYGLSSNQ